MSRIYETAAVLVLVAVVVYGLVRVVFALLDSHTGNSSMQDASSMFFPSRMLFQAAENFAPYR